jgi:hypothetical protein
MVPNNLLDEMSNQEDNRTYDLGEAGMTRSVLQVTVVTVVCILLGSAANAQSFSAESTAISAVPIRKAPAPLLAAGIPAFLALGGGALIGKIVRRRKADTKSDSN